MPNPIGSEGASMTRNRQLASTETTVLHVAAEVLEVSSGRHVGDLKQAVAARRPTTPPGRRAGGR